MRVLIPSALRSYTGAQAWVEADGATLADLLVDLDQQYPGIRFRMIDEQQRIRRHIRVFCAGQQLPSIDAPLDGSDEVLIVQALSGG
ncbi:MAG: MoaD/ThiS family protein [Rhodocyclaceae bacterium]|nr:MoaD/ThiS family protein [Rhodocyclaceae bacterium]